MRILHTADWHLGKSIAGRCRSAEHEAFIDELVLMAHDVDLVVIAGDVFDTYNPPSHAEALFYDALARLADGGRRAVVAIAGNHDSPRRVAAPSPLAGSHGVFLFGLPGDSVRAQSSGAVRGIPLGPSVLGLSVQSGEEAVVAALPFASESRIRHLLGPGRGGECPSERLAAGFTRVSSCFRPDKLRLGMAHLHVAECRHTESERPLTGLNGLVNPDILPDVDYLALGHLHLAQGVPGRESARYSGSPLAFRMSERGDPKSVARVECRVGETPEVELLPVTSGRPMARWEMATLAEVVAAVQSGRDERAWIELVMNCQRPLRQAELATLRRLERDFVRVRHAVPLAVGTASPTERRSLELPELFLAFHRSEAGSDASPALVSLFLDVAREAGIEEGALDGATPGESSDRSEGPTEASPRVAGTTSPWGETSDRTENDGNRPIAPSDPPLGGLYATA